MKKRARILSLISAAVIGATMCFTACGQKEVAEHDHIWNDGEVTTRPTCHSEGVTTFTCTVEGCGKTKTQPIGKTEHNWNEGEVTKEPKCNEVGERTFTCQNEGCTETKKEDIDKVGHNFDGGVITTAPDFFKKGEKTLTCADCGTTKKEYVDACADFEAQFYTDAANKNGWTYGYASAFDESAKTLTFAEAAYSENAWTADGVSIGKGTISAEAGKIAAVGYKFEAPPVKVQAKANITFKSDGEGAFKAYLLYPHGGANEMENLTPNGEKDFTYSSEQAIDLEEGAFYVVLKNDGDKTASGTLTFTLTAPCVHIWDEGEVTTQPTCHSAGVKTYNCINCDVKKTEDVATIPHTMNEGVVTTQPTCHSLGVKTYTCTVDGCGHTETEDVPMTAHNWNDGVITKPATTSEKGVMTFTCQNEDCGATKTEDIPVLGSSPYFKDNFAINDEGEFNGWSVGVVNYTFEDEIFDYTKITGKNGAGDAYNDNTHGWKEIRADWMAVNEMMGFAYKFGASGKYAVDFHLQAFKDDNLEEEGGKFSLRWAVKSSDGTIKTGGGKASWVGDGNTINFTQTIDVEATDTVYLLVKKEDGSNTDQCKFDIGIFSETASFGNDFQKMLDGEQTCWGINTINFVFGGDEDNTFTATPVTGKDNEKFTSGDPFAEVKGDWMASEAMIGLSYTAAEAQNAVFNIVVNCDGDDAKCSVRWAVMASDGSIKTNGGKASWGGDGKDVDYFSKIELEEGDTLHVLINYENTKETGEKSGNQKHFYLSLFEI